MASKSTHNIDKQSEKIYNRLLKKEQLRQAALQNNEEYSSKSEQEEEGTEFIQSDEEDELQNELVGFNLGEDDESEDNMASGFAKLKIKNETKKMSV